MAQNKREHRSNEERAVAWDAAVRSDANRLTARLRRSINKTRKLAQKWLDAGHGPACGCAYCTDAAPTIKDNRAAVAGLVWLFPGIECDLPTVYRSLAELATDAERMRAQNRGPSGGAEQADTPASAEAPPE